jgi:hypothetical protein
VLFTLLALVLTGPALLGRAALGPDAALDADALYASGRRPPPPLFNDFTPICLDLPRDLAFARGLHAGRFDHWNPLSGAGAPLWADQGGVLFPLKLPFYAASSPRTYDVFRALRLVVAGFGAYLLARRRGLGVVGALAAGALFELSGTMVAQLAFGSASATCMLPWALLGAEAIAQGGGGRPVAAAAVALGVAGSGGHPGMALVVFAAFATAIATHVLQRWRRPAVAALVGLRGALAFALGIGLAAPAFLPLAELVGAARTYKGTWLAAAFRALTLDEIRRTLPLALFAPGVLEVMRPYLRAVFPSALGPALGVVGLAAAVAGIIRGGLGIPLAAVATLGAILTTAPPGLGWVGKLPGLVYLTPGYAWPLVVLPLTQAAGRGVEVFGVSSERRIARLALAVVVVGAVSLGLVGDSAIRYPMHLAYGTVLRRVLAAPEGALRLVASVLLAGLSLLVVRRWRHATAAIATIAVLETLVIMGPFTRLPPSTVLVQPPGDAVRFLQEQLAAGDGRVLGVPQTVGAPMTGALFAIPDVRGISALPLRRYVDFLEAISPTPSLNPFAVQKVNQHASPLLDVAAVRFVIVPRGPSAPPALLDGDPEMPLAFTAPAVVIYENRAALPRARIVHRMVAARDMADATAAIFRASERGRHAREAGMADAVIVEPDEKGGLPPALADGPGGDTHVRIVDADDPDELVVHASLERPGLLVLADTYYEGWEARVDGQPSPIYPANLMFRAVAVPEGSHTIHFRFRPRAFRLGCALFVFAALGCVVLALRRA